MGNKRKVVEKVRSEKTKRVRRDGLCPWKRRPLSHPEHGVVADADRISEVFRDNICTSSYKELRHVQRKLLGRRLEGQLRVYVAASPGTGKSLAMAVSRLLDLEAWRCRGCGTEEAHGLVVAPSITILAQLLRDMWHATPAHVIYAPRDVITEFSGKESARGLWVLRPSEARFEKLESHRELSDPHLAKDISHVYRFAHEPPRRGGDEWLHEFRLQDCWSRAEYFDPAQIARRQRHLARCCAGEGPPPGGWVEECAEYARARVLDIGLLAHHPREYPGVPATVLCSYSGLDSVVDACMRLKLRFASTHFDEFHHIFNNNSARGWKHSYWRACKLLSEGGGMFAFSGTPLSLQLHAHLKSFEEEFSYEVYQEKDAIAAGDILRQEVTVYGTDACDAFLPGPLFRPLFECYVRSRDEYRRLHPTSREPGHGRRLPTLEQEVKKVRWAACRLLVTAAMQVLFTHATMRCPDNPRWTLADKALATEESNAAAFALQEVGRWMQAEEHAEQVRLHWFMPLLRQLAQPDFDIFDTRDLDFLAGELLRFHFVAPNEDAQARIDCLRRTDEPCGLEFSCDGRSLTGRPRFQLVINCRALFEGASANATALLVFHATGLESMSQVFVNQARARVSRLAEHKKFSTLVTFIPGDADGERERAILDTLILAAGGPQLTAQVSVQEPAPAERLESPDKCPLRSEDEPDALRLPKPPDGQCGDLLQEGGAESPEDAKGGDVLGTEGVLELPDSAQSGEPLQRGGGSTELPDDLGRPLLRPEDAPSPCELCGDLLQAEEAAEAEEGEIQDYFCHDSSHPLVQILIQSLVTSAPQELRGQDLCELPALRVRAPWGLMDEVSTAYRLCVARKRTASSATSAQEASGEAAILLPPSFCLLVLIQFQRPNTSGGASGCVAGLVSPRRPKNSAHSHLGVEYLQVCLECGAGTVPWSLPELENMVKKRLRAHHVFRCQEDGRGEKLISAVSGTHQRFVVVRESRGQGNKREAGPPVAFQDEPAGVQLRPSVWQPLARSGFLLACSTNVLTFRLYGSGNPNSGCKRGATSLEADPRDYGKSCLFAVQVDEGELGEVSALDAERIHARLCRQVQNFLNTPTQRPQNHEHLSREQVASRYALVAMGRLPRSNSVYFALLWVDEHHAVRYRRLDTRGVVRDNHQGWLKEMAKNHRITSAEQWHFRPCGKQGGSVQEYYFLESALPLRGCLSYNADHPEGARLLKLSVDETHYSRILMAEPDRNRCRRSAGQIARALWLDSSLPLEEASWVEAAVYCEGRDKLGFDSELRQHLCWFCIQESCFIGSKQLGSKSVESRPSHRSQ